jgi:hypothetical protein
MKRFLVFCNVLFFFYFTALFLSRFRSDIAAFTQNQVTNLVKYPTLRIEVASTISFCTVGDWNNTPIFRSLGEVKRHEKIVDGRFIDPRAYAVLSKIIVIPGVEYVMLNNYTIIIFAGGRFSSKKIGKEAYLILSKFEN